MGLEPARHTRLPAGLRWGTSWKLPPRFVASHVSHREWGCLGSFTSLDGLLRWPSRLTAIYYTGHQKIEVWLALFEDLALTGATRMIASLPHDHKRPTPSCH